MFMLNSLKLFFSINSCLVYFERNVEEVENTALNGIQCEAFFNCVFVMTLMDAFKVVFKPTEVLVRQ